MDQFGYTEVDAGRSAQQTRIAGFDSRLLWNEIWPWCAAWMAISLAILVCVLTIDHPLALIVRERIGPSRPAYLVVRLPEVVAGLTIIGAALLGIRRTLMGPLRGIWNDVFLACVGVCVVLALKSELKLLFGRVPPDTWFGHQSAPLRNFHLFYAGSFPSGHAAVLGVLTAFVWAWPAPLRLAWLSVCLAVGGALMVVGAHFLTDVIAGALLGVTIGAACRRIARS
jgi:membrane-associated phospholipid phosphatase